jgi:ElaB/YqjD/DUF883 family membrane-anchored ribosome-binding protein
MERDMTDEQTKMLDKVRKLLALSRSPNENEAASAAAKAHALLAEYNLSISDLDVTASADEDQFVLDRDMTTDSTPWRRRIAAAVAKLYFCKYFFQHYREPTINRTTGYIRHDIHSFVGARHNVDVAKLMFAYLSDTVARLANEGSKTVPTGERSRYVTSFKAACSMRLVQRIMERYEAAKRGEVKTESGSNLPALLNTYLTVQNQLDAFISKEVGRLGQSRSRATLSHGKGMMDGRRHGDSIGLDPQVGAGRRSNLLGRK